MASMGLSAVLMSRIVSKGPVVPHPHHLIYHRTLVLFSSVLACLDSFWKPCLSSHAFHLPETPLQSLAETDRPARCVKQASVEHASVEQASVEHASVEHVSMRRATSRRLHTGP